MAELDKHMFGNIKGKFGKAVFRQRNGVNYIAQRPSSYTAPGGEEYQKRTGKFKITSKIASVINSVPLLKEIWSLNTPKNLSVYNYLISKNYPAINDDRTTGLLKITPDSKIGVRLNTVQLTTDKLTVNLFPLTESSLIDPVVEKKVQIISILCLSSPLDPALPGFEVVPFISSAKVFDLDTAVAFEILISTANESLIALYQNKSIHSTLITYSENDTLINYSSTFSYTLV